MFEMKVLVFKHHSDEDRDKLSRLLNDRWAIERADCVHVSTGGIRTMLYGPIVYVLKRVKI